MYHALVRRRIRREFERLSAAQFDAMLAGLAPDVRHVFPGDHPLGGERRTVDGVARWFERLHRLFPGHDFTVHRIVSGGWPWSTWVAVQWTARLTPQVGPPYINDGAHWIHIRWARVTDFHAYLDTQLVAEACRHMAVNGVDEAGADPIGDAPAAASV
jgi:ketosteroid isomerase-like protein